jgi:tripartite ATP-independent transporter DctM subunit
MESLTLVALPLFILGGLILEQSGIIESLFAFLDFIFRGFLAGLPIAVTVLGAIFCAITGSTTAATSVVAAVTLPHMLERGYNKNLSMGVIAGSTVGTLIPPSLAVVIYAVITGDSVAELFMALIGPAILLFGLYFIYILFMTFKRPELVVEKGKNLILKRERAKKGQFKSLFMPTIWGFLMPVLILGGIYFGVFTPTESASALVVYAIFVAKFVRKKNFSTILKGIFNGTKISGMILCILVGAGVFSIIISQLRISRLVVNFVNDLGLGALPVTLIIFAVLLVLGMFLNAAPIIAITLPVFYPLAKAVGIDSLVLAVFYLIVLEIGALTLPVGVNLFAISAVSGEPVEKIFRASIPFIVMMLITVIIIFIFPEIVNWIPGTMYKFR